MISYLNGIIQNKRNNFVIINIGGVGYKVFVNEKLFSELKLGSEFEVYTYQHVREDALDLYGFRNLEELGMFELLLSISGIGPKSALGVLAVAAIQDIRDTIARGDSSLLVKVSGIGKKTAERVVLELRDKVGYLAVSGVAGTTCDISSSRDEIDALIALGYSLQQAREALQKVDSQITDSGERIREALKGI
ncbi:Holliday junction DNA helicase RuvA [Candidatus Falkowbacteria bacterium RIFOXYB2_FULL_34_18]|uniref:Holliday junction branch migration complex subunit RuvA n=1 Tax=Candidatus Falkowbacteria bacterium RIFOXYD2_FULL_34_120 TaxID=1798007 RepID=A0A1F5TMA6_9BACT|nr:MAG: Holliday junction DNA helicase RuvA [Candidatus Falkowbacteria bacterium RIFOXYB2_FULL_34_18]OGF29240.1 MAG: Holliday junction DNA helicase RuvA [Candidatus Falkowbacteria bacterium RIFOXYC12_FULL_34_55]OGF36982.1 MAG: Holliday junction DNA helicase RuvA [Candidatus Falkowbacteria bacterium RIFOXYC2_FULL_34_220]OGF38762.1 MAG: Holliday junction DNA helicase RuvA [Candidatus Falkowbacteria bacterium RIFOXYD12_FULL_34_57]OGF39996.1 MAG: Holliday junction DNA helicase RuvA [Candidatus Falk